MKGKLKTVGNKDKTVKGEIEDAADLTKDYLEKLRIGQILSENEYFTLSRKFGNIFKASSGAEAVQQILQKLDMKKEVKLIEAELEGAKDPMAQSKLLRRLKMFKAMIRNGGRPEWMIMTVLPVLPPDLRPMVALDGGRYATSDLNDLYRRVINRNNRLKKLFEIKAPDVIVRNEKRMLQEAVDALIDNSARFGTQQLSAQRRPLRSLADMLEGQAGPFPPEPSRQARGLFRPLRDRRRSEAQARPDGHSEAHGVGTLPSVRHQRDHQAGIGAQHPQRLALYRRAHAGSARHS